MDTAKRRREIEKLIRAEREIRTTDLIKRFNVSNVTIRNDLMYLEQKGIIKRNFGEVILKEEQEINSGYVRNLKEKEKIGKYAATMIGENESVMIYTGSTGLQVAKNIANLKNINIVTNSAEIAYEASKNPYAKVILIGGFYNHDTHATYGQVAINQLEMYNIDKLFLSLDGISVKDGLTNDHPYENDINKALINKAKEIIAIADYSKIGVSRFSSIGSVEDLDMLITDNKASAEEIEKIKEKGVKVVVV